MRWFFEWLDRRAILRYVQDGVSLLDGARPGWDREIDLDRLNIASGTDCVLGQLYGTYHKGREALNIGDGHPYAFSSMSERTVNQYWREVIQARRGADRRAA